MTETATAPLRTRAELAGGEAPATYRPRLAVIRAIERGLAPYFRAQLRAARLGLTILGKDEKEPLDLSPEQADRALEQILPRVRATKQRKRAKRALTVALTELFVAARDRERRIAKREARKLESETGRTVRKARPSPELALQDDFEMPPELAAAQWAERHVGDMMRDLDRTTRRRVRVQIQQGIDGGMSIREIATELQKLDGLWTERRSKTMSRAEMIARTETGMAYNLASLMGYAESEVVEQVNVYDNEAPGSCKACEDANGQVWTLAEARAKPLEHPNCLRSFAARISLEVEKPPEKPPPAPKMDLVRRHGRVSDRGASGATKRLQGWVDELPEGIQRELEDFGPVKYELYDKATWKAECDRIFGEGRGVAGFYWEGTNTIYLPMAGTRSRNLFLHELGHHVQRVAEKSGSELGPALGTSNGVFQNAVGEWNASTYSERRRMMRRVISDYGMTNNREFFAESFMHYAKGNEKRFKRSPETGKIWDAFVNAFGVPGGG